MNTLRHWMSLTGTTILVLLTACALVGESTVVSQPTVHATQQLLHKDAVVPSHNRAALPADLVPIIAQTLAAHSPATSNTQVNKQAVVFDNLAQHLSTSFSRHGARLQIGGVQPNQLNMQLLALQSGKANYPVITSAPPAVHNNRVELARGQGLTEWYVNSPLGVEQGFTVAKPISTADSLVLVLSLHGDLAPRLNANTLEFMNAQGKAVLRYGDLLAYDAHHHVLTTHMQLKGHNLLINVDTAGARYPIVIDPLFAVITSISDTFPSANETFGLSVALSDDGNTALIGAPGVTTLAPPVTNAGDVFIFTRSNGVWSLAAILFDPATTNYDGFGQSVSLSGDGTRALIGTNAGCPNCGTSGTGAAYLFIQSNGSWPSSPTSTFSDPAAQSGDYFGYKVALSGSGNTALIGAFGTNYYNPNLSQVGVAWVFTETGGSWAANPAAAAALVSNPVAAGALVGYSVALSYYGTSALVGAPGTDVGGNASVGAAYLYNRPGGGWSGTPSPSQSFYDPSIRANGNLGSSVAITSDGTSVLIGGDGTHTGVPGVGVAYVFTQSNGTWSGVPSGTLSDQTGSTDDFGVNVAFSSTNGTVALIGAPYATVSGQSAAGAVYAFVENNGTWPTSPTVRLMNPATASGDLFGLDLAISGDGSSALAGAFGTTVQSQAGSGMVYALGPAADLSLALASNPASVIVSHNTTYMLTATNNDTQVTVTNLSLTDTLPAGMTYVSASAAGGTCNNASGTVTCTLASLAPQATWQPSITVTATATGSIHDTAAVSASQLDTNMANNTATVTTTVTPPPPVAANGSVTTNAGTAVNGMLAATGTGPLAFAIVAQPGHGTVSITNAATGAFTYTPASGYSGTDSFTFTASNSGGVSNTATESVTVNSAGGGGGGGGSSSGGGGGGAFGFLSLLLLAPLVRLRKRKLYERHSRRDEEIAAKEGRSYRKLATV